MGGIIAFGPSSTSKPENKQHPFAPYPERSEKETERGGEVASMGATRLLVCDFVISFMWVWSGALIKMFVYEVLGLGHGLRGEIVKSSLYIANMFFFALLGKLTKGGSYNPLTVLAPGVSGDFGRFLFTVGARIPAQVRFRALPTLVLVCFGPGRLIFLAR